MSRFEPSLAGVPRAELEQRLVDAEGTIAMYRESAAYAWNLAARLAREKLVREGRFADRFFGPEEP